MTTPLERINSKRSKATDDLSVEYKTLRDEVLQLYREQAQLAFTSTLPLLGSILIREPSLIGQRWLILGAALLLLWGLSWKLRANYYKIFCIGTYLSVVHERRGKAAAEFAPGPASPGWHTRWRKIDEAPKRHSELKGQLGRASARADAAFVASIAAALVFFTVGQSAGQVLDFLIGIPELSWGSLSWTSKFGGAISALAMAFLIKNLRQLWDIQKYVGKYRIELELMIIEGRC